MRYLVRLLLLGAALTGIGLASAALLANNADSVQDQPPNRILARAFAIHQGAAKPKKFEAPISAGVISVLEQALAPRQPGGGGPGDGISSLGTQGCSNRFTGGVLVNIRVNQDCSRRRQAEEVVVVNPTNPNNLIAGQNDSRIGFNHCGYDWSFDGGSTWGDQVPPFWQFIMADGHTADACSDPTATFDSKGNAYVAGILFDIFSPASAFIVMKSKAPIGGAFYHSPHPLPFQTLRTDPPGVVASDNDPSVFHDKEFIVADANPGSPKADNVYATWTRFAETDFGVGVNSPIYFSQSTDGGATWSPGIEISGSGPMCTDFSGSADPNACDQDQGSHPIVGPDGTVYVAFGNGNTPEVGINQVLFVKCRASADCTNPASWTPPVKVGDLIGTHPIGDPGNPGGCPVGRQCLPPNGYRVPEFTSISISVDAASRLYTVWSDFRNGDDPGSTCGPLLLWTQARPPCNNDVFYATSTDGGATWSHTRNVTPRAEFGETAQWQPWSDVSSDGTLSVGFYDRRYGNCEFTGCNDYTLAKVRDASSGSPTYSYLRVTTGSMPNLIPANNPIQAGFLGDYSWVDVDQNKTTHVVWADTRPLFGPVPEEDIYYARAPSSSVP